MAAVLAAPNPLKVSLPVFKLPPAVQDEASHSSQFVKCPGSPPAMKALSAVPPQAKFACPPLRSATSVQVVPL